VARYVPLDARGFRLAMGLRPLNDDEWLEVDSRRDGELALKRQLLSDRRDVVIASQSDGDEPSRELLREIVRWLEQFHPELSTTPAPDHPIVVAAQLVQEDLCVLVKSDDWRLVAAAVCFPSRWSLASKIGATLDEIHGPVPGYAAELASPTTALFDRLRPDRSFWRLNWTLLDRSDLHQPVGSSGTSSSDLSEWFFRVERQTLRALPESGAIVFTIRTYVDDVETLMASDAEFGVHLARALETAPPATQEYKGWVGVADLLRERLTSG
jgi:dimethylamine monooxygenase subunit A